MGYKAFFTMAYFPLRHLNKPYCCAQAALMLATTMTLDQLGENGRGVGGCAIAIPHFMSHSPSGIEYKVPTTDKDGVCIGGSGEDFVQLNKALKDATGSGSNFELRKIKISSWEVFLEKEGVFILTTRYYEVSLSVDHSKTPHLNLLPDVWQHPEDREELEQCEYLPHYVVYNASLRMFYGQNKNYLLEPDDVANLEGVEGVMKVLLQETGIHIPNYGAKANMNRQLYIKA